MTTTKRSNSWLHYLSLAIKVIGDRSMALLLLLLFSPILVVVAILVRLRMGSPIVFSQERPGKNNRIFTVYKFRTMTGDCDADGNLLSDQERLIPLGQ
ncbi:MAG: sugar transferase, partial [Chamaesiphon sp.]|nr:sugar transferase [Chamaesiphon sp.]